MARIVRFAALNPIQFAEGSKAAKYNTKYFDEGWNYSATVKDYEDNKPYLHPVRFSDVISLQVLIAPIDISAVLALTNTPASTAIPALVNYPVIDLLDKNNNVIDTAITPSEGHVIQGFEFGNNTEDACVFQFNFTLGYSFDLSTQGVYRLRFKANYDDAESPSYTYHYSEWLDVKAEHPGTVLIQYNNTINDFDTYFEQLHPRFAKRIKGDVHTYEPGAVVTGYANQTEVFTQLSSVPFDTFLFTAISVPDFELKKLNHIFSCDKLKIDGKLFSRDDGAKWEVQRPDTHPLKGISVKLRAGTNTHSQDTVSKRTYFEWVGYTTPKWYHRPQLNNFIGQLIILREDVIVEDTPGGEALADALNDEAPGYFLEGTFGFDGRLYYDNADGENFYAGLDKIMAGIMNIEVTIPADNTPFFFTSKGGYLGLDWGDDSLNFYTPPTGAFSPQHTFATAGDYTLRMFHDGPASGTTQLIFQQQQVVPPTRMITNITGLAPWALQVFSMTFADLDSSFDMSFLQKTWATLKQLTISDCNMTHPFIGNLWNYGTPVKWGVLKQIDFRFNKLSATGVDAALNQWFNNNNGIYYIFVPMAFKIEGQSPSAPPTSASLTARNIGSGAGWTITTD